MASVAPKMKLGQGLNGFQKALVLWGSSLLGALVLYATVRWAAGISHPTPWVHSTAISVHLITVIPALPLGAYILLAPKGTANHRLLGTIWMVLMMVTATSTIWIRNVNDGSFSFIHLFVILTYVSVPRAIYHARKGQIEQHKKEVLGLFIGALLVAGAASFIPHRTMYLWAFG